MTGKDYICFNNAETIVYLNVQILMRLPITWSEVILSGQREKGKKTKKEKYLIAIIRAH